MAVPVLNSVVGLDAPADPDGDIEASGDTSAINIPGIYSLTKVAKHREIEGYASVSSTVPGGSVGLDISCSRSSTFKADIYRMGYYSGNGALLEQRLSNKRCVRQPKPSLDAATATVDTLWHQTEHLSIPRSWSPGYYLVRLTRADGYQSYIPFLVRTKTPANKYLFVDAVATSAAYNDWGGNSLYVGIASAKYGRSFTSSLNRPFAINHGAGDFLDWEYPMIRYLERNNYAVDYATDIDINNDPAMLLNYKAIILTGHDEYWSWPMLKGYQRAVASGVNLAIFGANTDYRPMRVQMDTTTRQHDRVIVCYKAAHLDPAYRAYTDNQLTSLTPRSFSSFQITAFNWRTFNVPESNILGESYSGLDKDSGDYTISDSSNWIFTHTGLSDGDTIPHIVGYEYDKVDSNFPEPSGLTTLMSSTLPNSNQANATIYTATGGGQVFDAGTVQWSWGLEPSYVNYANSDLQTITSNILDQFGN